MTISAELKEVYSSAKDDVILHTLEFNHSSFDAPVYLVRDFEDLIANLENDGPEVTFQAVAFQITPPKKDDQGSQSLNIQIDNVGKIIMSKLEAAIDGKNQPISVTYRIYLASDTSGPQNDPPLTFFLNSVSVDNMSVSGTAEIVGLINRKFPKVTYGQTFKSLYYQ